MTFTESAELEPAEPYAESNGPFAFSRQLLPSSQPAKASLFDSCSENQNAGGVLLGLRAGLEPAAPSPTPDWTCTPRQHFRNQKLAGCKEDREKQVGAILTATGGSLALRHQKHHNSYRRCPVDSAN